MPEVGNMHNLTNFSQDLHNKTGKAVQMGLY